MKTIKINGKIMEEKLKRGWTVSRFAERFQVSEEEFLEALQKTFTTKAYSEMIKTLRRNEKKVHPRKTEHLTEVVTEKTDVELTTNFKTLISSDEEVDTTPSLEKQKEELENSLNEQELQHKHLAEGRTNLRKDISKLEDKLIAIKKEISNYRRELESLLLQYEEKHSEMQKLNSKIAETKEKLERVISAIKEKEKTTIFVYQSGDIEFESDSKFEILDWNSTFNRLLSEEIVEDLTVKQIKTLAQCIAYAELFISTSVSYEIIFEDSKVEKCFVNLLST